MEGLGKEKGRKDEGCRKGSSPGGGKILFTLLHTYRLLVTQCDEGRHQHKGLAGGKKLAQGVRAWLSHIYTHFSTLTAFSLHSATKGSTSIKGLPVVSSRRSARISETMDLPPLVGAQYTRFLPSSTSGWHRHSA